MKKLLLTTILTVALACTSVDASMVLIDYFGDTLVTSNNIERPLIVSSDDGKAYNIAMKPLQETVSNADGSVNIPLEYLFINNTKEDVYLKFNEYSNVIYGGTMESTPRNMTAKIKNYGIVPSGEYSITFQVEARDIETSEVASISNFTLIFVVPEVHELNLYSESSNITISSENAFKTLTQIPNETSPIVYIRSNTDWILSLDTTNFGETQGNYYVRTVSGSSMVTTRLQEKALITPGTEIILARGKAPAVNETVAVEFSIEIPDGKIIPTGNYANFVKYILRKGEI